jgi:hypothetical protein
VWKVTVRREEERITRVYVQCCECISLIITAGFRAKGPRIA